MSVNQNLQQNGRRNFLGSLATGVAAISMTGIATPLNLQAAADHIIPLTSDDPDVWFNNIKGKHRVVFDVTQPHEIYPFAWPRVFLLTNSMTGTPENDCGVVVVLRHSAIGYAMDNQVWSKYKFGELFDAKDPATHQPATQNPFWQPGPGAFKVPGVGEVSIGINELQDAGVMFCVCDMAMTVYSAAAASKMNMNADDVKKEWKAALLPGIQPVPSGVWALGRAHEKGCAYIFAG